MLEDATVVAVVEHASTVTAVAIVTSAVGPTRGRSGFMNVPGSARSKRGSSISQIVREVKGQAAQIRSHSRMRSAYCVPGDPGWLL